MTRTSVLPPDVQEFIQAAHQIYGYDFSHYSSASFLRCLNRAAQKNRCRDIYDLIGRIKDDPSFFSIFLSDLTITVTEMFRDPKVYLSMREKLVSHLATYPEIKIWSAGCSEGEEAYSLAILLQEEGLLDRTLIYATDINPAALRKAREGCFSLHTIKEAVKNYVIAGGKDHLSTYYSIDQNIIKFDDHLKKHLIFSDHNLVSDGIFGEMQLVLCRNVLIYFNRHLQEQSLGLFKESLCRGGFLCLGLKENLNLTRHQLDFKEIDKSHKIYQKNF